jgi:hypothetical protein
MLLQATQNGSDLWLSYWVSHAHQEEVKANFLAASVMGTESSSSPWMDMRHSDNSTHWQGILTLQPPTQSGAAFLFHQLCALWQPLPVHAAAFKEPFREATSTPAGAYSLSGGSQEEAYTARRLKEAAEAWPASQSNSPQRNHGKGEDRGAAGRLLEVLRRLQRDLVRGAHRRWHLGLVQLQPDVQFYLTVLLTLAVANSVFILVKFLTFVYGYYDHYQDACSAYLSVCGPLQTRRFSSPACTV